MKSITLRKLAMENIQQPICGSSNYGPSSLHQATAALLATTTAAMLMGAAPVWSQTGTGGNGGGGNKKAAMGSAGTTVTNGVNTACQGTASADSQMLLIA